MTYTIEQRIHTLAQNAILGDEKAGFTVDNVGFVHWGSDVTHDWSYDFWLATTQVDAENYHLAFLQFRAALLRIVTRISLISQCYIDSVLQPYLILKQGEKVAFFRHTKDVDPVGLMFTEDQLKALKSLCANADISQAFYSYWCDVVNATGYTPKLGLMFCALEALVKKASGKKDWDKLNAILGKDLCDEIFLPTTGLRHRLTHGEYFDESDTKNFIDVIHSKIIQYFNSSVLGQMLLQENVVAPQRNVLLNKEEIRVFVKPSSERAKLVLSDVLDDFEKNGIYQLKKYEPIADKALEASY